MVAGDVVGGGDGGKGPGHGGGIALRHGTVLVQQVPHQENIIRPLRLQSGRHQGLVALQQCLRRGGNGVLTGGAHLDQLYVETIQLLVKFVSHISILLIRTGL